MADENNEPIQITSESIKDRIYTIRGVQVMLDSDLAELYKVETMRLNEAVKRNAKRFPDRFAFGLTKEEYDVILKSQNAISSGWGGRRKLPKVFTEQGVSMLSAVLRSDIAIEVSLKIIDAFILMRHFAINNAGLFQRIDNIEKKQIQMQIESDEKFSEVFKQLAVSHPAKAIIFYKGEMYDARSLISDLMKLAKQEIILIDDYISKVTLDFLRLKDKAVIEGLLNYLEGRP